MGEILLLGRDKVASIRVLGGGKLGEKSVNLFRKERVLEDCGFLFPRRNLVIASDLLLDGLAYAGHKDGWEAASMPQSEEFRRRFCAWMIGEVWPAANCVGGSDGGCANFAGHLSAARSAGAGSEGG